MPKGALLHAHLDATVNPEILLKLALQYPVFHVRVNHEPLSISNLSTNLPEFRALPPDYVSDFNSLTEKSYTLGSWVQLQKARDSFGFGGREGFDKWVIGALTINPAEAYGTHNTVKKASLSTFGFKCLFSSLLVNRFGQSLQAHSLHLLFVLTFSDSFHLAHKIYRVSFDLNPCFRDIS